MKICILAPRFPFPETGGDVLRMNHIAQYLKEKGHQVVLVSFYESASDLKNKNTGIYKRIYLVKRSVIISAVHVMKALFSKTPLQCAYYNSDNYLKVFQMVLQQEKPDLYIAHTGRMVQYLEACSLRKQSIVDLADALSKTYSLVNISSLNSYKKYVYCIERKRIQKFEQFLISKYRKVILVSEADKQFLGNKESLFVHKMGIPLNKQYPKNYNEGKIVFVGNMRTLQNQDAAVYFAKQIFPKLIKIKPGITFHIIGAEPPIRIQKLSDRKSIFVTGFVESIEREIENACLAVAPVRIAAGIQNKVLISMANHVPVVLSKTISLGITELVSGKNCYIAEKDSDYIRYCLRLLNSERERNLIADAGYKMVDKYYGWQQVLRGYENMPDESGGK